MNLVEELRSMGIDVESTPWMLVQMLKLYLSRKDTAISLPLQKSS